MDLEHRGYKGEYNWSTDDGVYHGKVLLETNDVILFESVSYFGINKAFKEAVDDYLEIKERHEL